MKEHPCPEPQDCARRLVRIETRLAKLMNHFGLTASGSPATPPTSSPIKVKNGHKEPTK